MRAVKNLKQNKEVSLIYIGNSLAQCTSNLAVYSSIQIIAKVRAAEMKRSEINEILQEAKTFLQAYRFTLPPWGYWNLKDWQANKERITEITRLGLGWDITDFGSGNFESIGLLLFTLRNGDINTAGAKPYAEKLIITREGQVTPLHFHWKKMEDIINRGGGNLVCELYNSTKDEDLANGPVTVNCDGIERTVASGEKLILQPGESVTLPTGLYHKFYGEPGQGTVLVGEVSMTNDDHSDNRFYEPVGRFPEVEEDEEPIHLLVSDYAQFL